MILTRVVLLSALLWAGSALAQQPPMDEPAPSTCPQADGLMPPDCDMLAMAGNEPDTPPPQGFKRRNKMMEERGKQIERIRTRKLLELLDLPSPKDSQFVDALRDMRREQRQIDGERRSIVDQLAEMVQNRRPNIDSINRLVDRRHELERDRQQIMDQFLAKVRSLLTPVQVAKLVVFEDRFEMAMLEQMRNFRQDRMRMPRGPHAPRPPAPDEDEDN